MSQSPRPISIEHYAGLLSMVPFGVFMAYLSYDYLPFELYVPGPRGHPGFGWPKEYPLEPMPTWIKVAWGVYGLWVVLQILALAGLRLPEPARNPVPAPETADSSAAAPQTSSKIYGVEPLAELPGNRTTHVHVVEQVDSESSIVRYQTHASLGSRFAAAINLGLAVFAWVAFEAGQRERTILYVTIPFGLFYLTRGALVRRTDFVHKAETLVVTERLLGIKIKSRRYSYAEIAVGIRFLAPIRLTRHGGYVAGSHPWVCIQTPHQEFVLADDNSGLANEAHLAAFRREVGML